MATERGYRGGTTRSFIGAAGANCIANTAWWMQPILMHELAISRGLGDALSGVVLSMEMAAMALASALVARFAVNRSLLLIALVGTGLAILGSLLSLETTSYWGLLGARSLAGIGAGACLMMSNTVAATFADPDKVFARLGVFNLLFGVALVAALPLMRQLVGGETPFLTMLAALVLLIIPVMFLSRRMLTGQPMRADETGNVKADALSKTANRNILLVALVILLVGIASGTVWAFYSLIGAKAGMAAAEVDAAISTAILAGLVGAGIAALIGSRFGRIAPTAIGLSLMTAAVIALSFNPTPTVFRIATCVNLATIYFLIPYFLGAAAAQDTTGRGAAYAGSAFFLSGAISPALGGILSATVGMQVVGFMIVVIAIFACVIIIRVERRTAAHDVDMSGESPVQALHKAL